MKIITHPANVELIKKMCIEGKFNHQMNPSVPLFGIEIVADSQLEKERWTGKWVLSDGKVVNAKDIHISSDEFFEYDYRDIKVLKWWGLIREEMEVLYYVINDTLSRFSLDSIFKPAFYFVRNSYV